MITPFDLLLVLIVALVGGVSATVLSSEFFLSRIKRALLSTTVQSSDDQYIHAKYGSAGINSVEAAERYLKRHALDKTLEYVVTSPRKQEYVV